MDRLTTAMSAAAAKEYVTCDAPCLRGSESQIEPQFARNIVIAFCDGIDAMKGHPRRASPNYNIAVVKRVPADSIAAPLTSPEEGCRYPE